jgi:hypothetical protein
VFWGVRTIDDPPAIAIFAFVTSRAAITTTTLCEAKAAAA